MLYRFRLNKTANIQYKSCFTIEPNIILANDWIVFFNDKD